MTTPVTGYEATYYGNAFRTPVPEQQYHAYAVPGVEDLGPYTRTQGWSPELETSAGGTPAANRLGLMPLYSRTVPAGQSPDAYYRKLDADDLNRHRQEVIDADGWDEQKQLPGDSNPGSSVYARWAPNPRATPVPEDRPTMRMSPRTYSFMRPFDQLNRAYGDVVVGSARRLNGVHFSMADHRREYPILGMRPVQQRRNTYRIEPPPWDADMVDVPENEPTVQSARISSPELPYPSRSFRL
jgi:hypothetical protein